MIVFVDASAYVSLILNTDRNHLAALQISKRLAAQEAKLITTNMVVGEVLTVVGMRHDKKLALDFGERQLSGETEIAHPDPDLFEDAWQIYKREVDKNVSFVDCMSFALIRKFHIPAAFAFDQDFLGRNFEVLR